MDEKPKLNDAYSSKKLPDNAIRSPEEVRKMMKEVSWLSKVFSGRHNVKVVALPGEGAWTCGIDHKYAKKIDEYMSGEIENIDDLPPEALVPKLITVRENDFYRDSPTEIRRKTRHEAAHAAHSDFKLLFQNARQAKDEGYLPSTYMSAANGPEDGWVNTMAAGESQAALEDFRNGYSQKMQEILPQLPHDPLARQFGVNVINYWLTGKDVEGIDPRVIEITNKVRPSLDRFYASNSAKENSEIFQKEIWPYIRNLEKHDVNDEQLRKMANQAMQEQEGQDGDNQSDEKSELGKQIEQELNQDQGGEQGSGGPQEVKPNNSQGNGEGQGEPQVSSSSQEGGDKPLDLSKLSPETLEKLRQKLEQLSPEVKQQIEKEARQEVDRRQSEKLNKESPQIVQMEKNKDTGEFVPKIQEADPDEVKKAEKKLEQFQQKETDREKQEMEQTRQEEEQKQRQLEAMQARQRKLDEMKKEGFKDEEEADFDKYKELEKEINTQYLALEQELGRIFPRQLKVVREGYYYSGRPDPQQAAHKFPIGSHEFYTRKSIEQSQQVNLNVWIALDISGTMRGTKIHESVKNIIMWSKLCDKYSIPLGIVVFGDSSEIIKNPNQAYSDPKERLKAAIIQKTNNPHQSTNMGAAVETINTELKSSRRRFPGMQGLALFIGDGAPTVGLTGPQLKESIEELQTPFSTFAFGLGTGQGEQQEMRQMLNSYFGVERTIIPKDFDELPRETAKVMTPIMRRLAQQLRY